jgi:hypothetical protein
MNSTASDTLHRTTAKPPFTDAAFVQFNDLLGRQYSSLRNRGNFFLTVSPNNSATLGELYLAKLQAIGGDWQRQYHNCRCCLNFINTAGCIVYVDDDNKIHTIWEHVDQEANPYAPIAQHLHKVVKSWAKTKSVEGRYFDGVYVQEERLIGVPMQGGYNHLYLASPGDNLPQTQTVSSYAAEVMQNMLLMQRALTLPHMQQLNVAHAISLTHSGRITRSDKILELLYKWLHLLKDVAGRVGYAKEARVWHYARHGIGGLGHITNTVAGQLLERLQLYGDNENTIDAINTMLSPHVYQRPQVDPTEQILLRANKLVATLGLEKSMERRRAQLADITHWIWREKPVVKAESPDKKDLGIFSEVKTKAKAKPAPTPKAMAWPPNDHSRLYNAKTVTHNFLRDRVLPMADEMSFFVDAQTRGYAQLMAPTHADAPSPFRWTYPINHYVHLYGSEPKMFGLKSGNWTKVIGLIKHPEFWGTDRQCNREILILEGCHDTFATDGRALFPEIMRSELHEVRAGIEALSKTTKLPPDPTSVGGLMVSTQLGRCSYKVAVKTGPVVNIYKVDRFE